MFYDYLARILDSRSRIHTHTCTYIRALAIGIRAIQSVYTHTEDSRDTHDVFQVAFRAMIDKCFDVRSRYDDD